MEEQYNMLFLWQPGSPAYLATNSMCTLRTHLVCSLNPLLGQNMHGKSSAFTKCGKVANNFLKTAVGNLALRI